MRGGFAVLLSMLFAVFSQSAMADDGRPKWMSSPFHRATNGDGKTIPCRCVVKGRSVPLGTTVCMATPEGVQMARCDLDQNVTSWVPTGAPCEISTLNSQLDTKG